MTTSPPSKKLLFLSDAHLGGFSKKENERIEQELINLIDFCMKNRIKIYVLGDLFDYWMEYPNYVPELGKKLREQFRTYNSKFGPTTYITGNHDNWTRSHFSELGFTVISDYEIIQADGKNILLLHGDGLLTTEGNINRPTMHYLLRDTEFIEMYQKILPPRSGLWVMKWFSRLNRMFGKYRVDTSKLNRWAKSYLEQTEIDLIICGHDHIPRKKVYSFGTYLNLGTFYKHRNIALYNNHSVDLVVWNDVTRQITNHVTPTA